MATIKGEYWVIEGSVNYADGDVGDTNHEGYALDHLRRKVLEAVDMEQEDMYDWDSCVEEMPDALDEILGPDPKRSAYERISRSARELALDPGDVDQAFENAAQDVRDYMAEKYGWIICHGDRFGTWFLTRDVIEIIAEAAGEILDQEGFFDDGDTEADVGLEIFVVSTNKTYSASWRALERGDFSELPLQETVPDPGPNAQVAKMDRELEHPYYQAR